MSEKPDIQKQLAALRAEELEQAQALKDKADANELAMRLALKEAVAKHGEGRVRGLLCDNGFAIFKAPPPAVYRMYIDKLANDKKQVTGDDMLQLVKPCLVSERSAWDTLEALEPAVISRAVSVVLRLAGHRQDSFLE